MAAPTNQSRNPDFPIKKPTPLFIPLSAFSTPSLVAARSLGMSVLPHRPTGRVEEDKEEEEENHCDL